MSLPSAVHVSSTFESGAPRMSLPSAVRQFSILHFYSEPFECHCLELFMHPPPKELGAMLHDCLSVDPLVQSSILHFFSEPHECHCLALFLCPPPSSLELCFMIA